jgi:uncharacterized protein (DUF4415 family)
VLTLRDPELAASTAVEHETVLPSSRDVLTGSATAAPHPEETKLSMDLSFGHRVFNTPEKIAARRRGRPVGSTAAVRKSATTIRFDEEVIQAFKAREVVPMLEGSPGPMAVTLPRKCDIDTPRFDRHKVGG